MIVDDEMLARIGIKSMIAWEQHGFEVVAEADNGQKALQLAQNLRPDIIITDIKMPVMDGVEFIQQLKKQEIHAKSIVLSAYDEFMYVKEAMRAGAEDYLIKLELQPEQLLTKLHQISDMLAKEKKQRDDLSPALPSAQQQLILQEALLREMLKGRSYSRQEVVNRFTVDAWSVLENFYVCYVIQLDSFAIYDKYSKDEVHLLDYAMRNLLEEVVSTREKAIILPTAEREVTILFPISDEHSLSNREQRAGLEQAIKNAMRTYLNTTVVIGVSNVHHSFTRIFPAYKEASFAINLRFSFQPGSTIYYQEVCHLKAQSIDLAQELKQFERVIMIGDEAQINELLQRIKEKAGQSGCISKDSIKGFCSALLYIVDSASLSQSTVRSSAWKESMENKLNRMGNLADFYQWTEAFGEHLMEVTLQLKETTKVIRSIKQYIAQHYAENIPLETLASQFNLSPNYISYVFKRETGKTIVEFLTECRIAQAKHLLETTNKKIYEIGQLVGYDNEHYFSRVFKKVTSVSPNRYK